MTTIEKAIATYGADAQLNVAIEEFAELTKEICKHKRYADNRANIIEEMADCYIMLDQLTIIFGITEAYEFVNGIVLKSRADTVRKMHSMLCEGRVSNDNVVIVANQIAKEMLERG